MENVRNEVARLRAERGHTQEELAGAVGVSRQTIIAVERGTYNPSVALALRLARHFRVPVEDVFTLTTHEEHRR
jgi:putative transcriptional regulator